MNAAPFPFPALLPRATEEAWFPPLETGELELLGQLEAQLEQRLLGIQMTTAPLPLGVVDGRVGEDEEEEEEEEEEDEEEDEEATAEEEEEDEDEGLDDEEDEEEGWETEQDEEDDVNLSDEMVV